MARKKVTHRSDSQWRETLAQQGTSGMSIKDFCQQNDVTVSAFYAARKRLGMQLPDQSLSEDEQQQSVFVALEPNLTSEENSTQNSQWAVALQIGANIILRVRG
jgi:hypothetical protein